MNIIPVQDLPLINGELLYLRPIGFEDTDSIVRWRNDPEVRKNFIFRSPFTKELHENWLRTKVARGEVIQYMIVDRQSDRPVGSVYYRDISPEHESAEYGIFIGEAAARGRGLGTETARLFTRFGLDVLGLHRIMLRVIGGNNPAKRSYEKAGFIQEGLCRHMVKLDGEYTDIILMAIVSEEG